MSPRTGWGEASERYWIDTDETSRRLELLNRWYVSIGIHDSGSRHDIDFIAATDDEQFVRERRFRAEEAFQSPGILAHTACH